MVETKGRMFLQRFSRFKVTILTVGCIFLVATFMLAVYWVQEANSSCGDACEHAIILCKIYGGFAVFICGLEGADSDACNYALDKADLYCGDMIVTCNN